MLIIIFNSMPPTVSSSNARRISKCKNAKMFLEERVDIFRWIVQKEKRTLQYTLVSDPLNSCRRQSGAWEKEPVRQCKQLKFSEQSCVCIICLDLSQLVEKSQVTGCERSKFPSGVCGMEAEASSYQDSGFASINVSLGCLCSSQTSVNTAILLSRRVMFPFDSYPQRIVSSMMSFPHVELRGLSLRRACPG